jgi:WD40 repeat protein
MALFFDASSYDNVYPEFIDGALDLGGTAGCSIKFNSRGNYCAVGCLNGSIKIFDFETRSLLRELRSAAPTPKSSIKGESASSSTTIAPPSIDNTNPTKDGHTLAVYSLSWFRNGRKLLTGSLDCKVLVWDLLTGKVERGWTFPSQVLRVELHPKSKYVIFYFYHKDVHYNRVF